MKFRRFQWLAVICEFEGHFDGGFVCEEGAGGLEVVDGFGGGADGVSLDVGADFWEVFFDYFGDFFGVFLVEGFDEFDFLADAHAADFFNFLGVED